MSRSANKAARDLLLGMKELPQEGGGWGLLLPRGAEPAELSPKAHGAVQVINPAYIEFVPHTSLSNRGVGVFYGAWFFLTFILMFSPLSIEHRDVSPENVEIDLIFRFVFWGL